jgi:hypothetical protein
VPTLIFHDDIDSLPKLLVAHCVQSALEQNIDLSKIILATKQTGITVDFEAEICKKTDLALI